MPFFYKEMIKCWEDISKSDPQTVNSIFAQKICLNACILVDNTPVSLNGQVLKINLIYKMEIFLNGGRLLMPYQIGGKQLFQTIDNLLMYLNILSNIYFI